MTNDLKPYNTGFMKPPKQSQFKKGKSGNPKGRPRQIEDSFLVLQKVLKRKLHVKGGGQSISIEEALIRRLRELALSGNRRAIQIQKKILSMANDLNGTHEPEADIMGAKQRLARMAGVTLDSEIVDGDQNG